MYFVVHPDRTKWIWGQWPHSSLHCTTLSYNQNWSGHFYLNEWPGNVSCHWMIESNYYYFVKKSHEGGSQCTGTSTIEGFIWPSRDLSLVRAVLHAVSDSCRCRVHRIRSASKRIRINGHRSAWCLQSIQKSNSTNGCLEAVLYRTRHLKKCLGGQIRLYSFVTVTDTKLQCNMLMIQHSIYSLINASFEFMLP